MRASLDQATDALTSQAVTIPCCDACKAVIHIRVMRILTTLTAFLLAGTARATNVPTWTAEELPFCGVVTVSAQTTSAAAHDAARQAQTTQVAQLLAKVAASEEGAPALPLPEPLRSLQDAALAAEVLSVEVTASGSRVVVRCPDPEAVASAVAALAAQQAPWQNRLNKLVTPALERLRLNFTHLARRLGDESHELPAWFAQPPALCGVGAAPVGHNLGKAVAEASEAARIDLSWSLAIGSMAEPQSNVAPGKKVSGRNPHDENRTDWPIRAGKAAIGARVTKMIQRDDELLVLVCFDGKLIADEMKAVRPPTAEARAALRKSMEKKLAKLDELTEE